MWCILMNKSLRTMYKSMFQSALVYSHTYLHPPPAPPPLLTTASLFSKHEQKLTETKERIAEVACLLVEDPEGNVSPLSKL